MTSRRIRERNEAKLARWASIVDRYRAIIETMRPDQLEFANGLLSSWRVVAWNTGRAIRVAGNCHVPVIRRAIRKALEQRP